MSFLAEIRRRKVFQVAAVYAVVAWLIIQIIDVVSDPLSLPEWLDTVVIVLLAVGFPIAVILAWAFDLTPEGVRATPEPENVNAHTRSPTQQLGLAMQGLILLAVAFLAADQYFLRPQVTAEAAGQLGSSTNRSSAQSSGVSRFTINIGTTEPVGNTGLRVHLALSSDGRQLVYAAQVNGVSQLYLRPIDRYQAQPIPDTRGAFYPFLSPDGNWVGFYTDVPDAHLKKVLLTGGTPQVLADATWSGGGTWLDNDTMIYSTGSPDNVRVLYRLAASVGEPSILLEPDVDSGHVWPHVLPGGDAVLFTVRPGRGGSGAADEGSIVAASLETREVRELVKRGHTATYTSTGHIVFARDGNLWAVPFDKENLRTLGPEVSVVAGVGQDSALGGAAYAISDTGLLIYAPGGDWRTQGDSERRLVWVDREQREQPLGIRTGTFEAMRLSPDGQYLAASYVTNGNSDIWIYDLTRGTSSRLTFDAAFDERPVWTPDGERIVFASNREGGGLFWKAVDGTGPTEPLTPSGARHVPEAFSPDGALLVYRQETQQSDLLLLTMEADGERTSRPLLESSSEENAAAISPDGAWLAYQSNESGRYEIYVKPFPDVDTGKWLVSVDGGIEPFWGPDGQELFYRSAEGTMSASIRTAPRFAAENHRLLIDKIYLSLAGAFPSYAVSPDGQRFLMIESGVVGSETQGSGVTQLNVVQNWFTELMQLAPVPE